MDDDRPHTHVRACKSCKLSCRDYVRVLDAGHSSSEVRRVLLLADRPSPLSLLLRT